MLRFRMKSGQSSTANKKSCRRAASFNVQQPTPVSILVRPGRREKQTKEKYEALRTSMSKPGNREAIYCDVLRNRKHVQWDNVALEITLPLNKSPRAQRKFVKLNDENIDNVNAQCAKEGCVAVPAESLRKPKGEPKVPLHVCTKKCFVVDENMNKTGKSNACPWTLPRCNRDYSSLAPVLQMPTMDNSRLRAQSAPMVRNTLKPTQPATQTSHKRDLASCSDNQRPPYYRLVSCH